MSTLPTLGPLDSEGLQTHQKKDTSLTEKWTKDMSCNREMPAIQMLINQGELKFTNNEENVKSKEMPPPSVSQIQECPG